MVTIPKRRRRSVNRDPFGLGLKSGGLDFFKPPKNNLFGSGFFPKGGGFKLPEGPKLNLDPFNEGGHVHYKRPRRPKAKAIYKPKIKYQPTKYPIRPRPRHREEEPKEEKKFSYGQMFNKVSAGTRNMVGQVKEKYQSYQQKTGEYQRLRSKYASYGWKSLSDDERKKLTSEAIKRGEYI